MSLPVLIGKATSTDNGRITMPRMRADAIQILVTLEERAKVQEMAKQNSLSMSSYARSRLMRAVQREAEQEELERKAARRRA
jgi:hypothetical protein